MRGRVAAALALTLSLAAPAATPAHTTATGLATVRIDGDVVHYRLVLVLADLPPEPARLLEAAAAGESAAAEPAAERVRRSVRARADSADCLPGRVTFQGSRLGDSRIVVELFLRCPAPPRRLWMREDWPDVLGEHYRTVARIETARHSLEVVFTPDARETVVEAAGPTDARRGGFFRLGVEHILSGYDHLLFLAALLVRGGRLPSLIKIVTGFTVAHSLTLALAVLGVVTVPARVVEPAIAASIVWVAVENIVSREGPSRRWVVSFLFGLVHGLGFASALEELALPPWRLAGALLGFNLGVEAGQGLVVAAGLPFLLWIRTRSWEPHAVRTVSGLLALAGAAWFVDRLFF